MPNIVVSKGSVAAWEAVLLSAVFFAPLAVGTVHPPVILSFCALVTASFVLYIRDGGSQPAAGRGARIFLWLLVFVCAATAFQMIPLPDRVLAIVSPAANEIGVSLRALIGTGSNFPISLAPPATALELVKAVAFLMIFIMASGSNRGAQKRLLSTIAFAGMAAITLVGLNWLIGGEAILGLVKPVADPAKPFLINTFVNPNHFSAFMTLCSLLSFGLSIYSASISKKLMYFAFSAVQGVFVFLSLSRGGIIAYTAGVLIFLVLILRRRGTRVLGLVACMALVFFVSLTVWLAADAEVTREISTMFSVERLTKDSKLNLFADAWKVAVAYWPAGVGRGAFESAAGMYVSSGSMSYSHAESEPLELACDLGIPFAALAVLLFLLVFIPAAARVRSPATTGAIAGVFAMSLHSLVDFHLETCGISFAFAACLGVIAIPPAKRDVPEPEPRHNARLLKIIAAFGVMAIPMGVWGAVHTLDLDTQRVSSVKRLQQL
jgi:hypothetical protein